MKYCGRFSNRINMDKFDEISIIYQRQSKELLEFLKKYPTQKIILVVGSQDFDEFYEHKTWELVNAIAERMPESNLSICFHDVGDCKVIDEKLQICIDNIKIPYFFGFIANDFEKLNYLCSKGVSEVYLAEEICFDLTRAKRICDRYGVKIRAFPNIAQSSLKAGPALNKFFIRPEDVPVYEGIIDTLEFWGPLDRQETVLDIYKQGYWFGDLREIILDLSCSIDSRTLVPVFAQARKDCQRKCLKGGACSICNRLVSIGDKLSEQGYIIKIKKPH